MMLKYYNGTLKDRIKAKWHSQKNVAMATTNFFVVTTYFCHSEAQYIQ